jgi:diaminopimelate decarboxylase
MHPASFSPPVPGISSRSLVIEGKTLPPLVHRYVARLVDERPKRIRSLVAQFGSPLNIVLPNVLVENVDALRAVLRDHHLPFEMFYGAKVNKSNALVRAAVESGIGVDVSSIYELRDALRSGADGSRLCATGPAKTRVFHAALIGAGALIAIDSREEFDDVLSLAREIAAEYPTRILLRYQPLSNSASRFGMTAADLLACLHRLAAVPEMLQFEGFHFHLSGYRYESRVETIAELAPLIDAARALGLSPRLLDIGGGMPVRYVDSALYNAFLLNQRETDYRNPRVPSSFYPYGGNIGAAEWLGRLLASSCARGLSVARYLNRERLTLALEPGRSLVDQAAVSVFRITRVKSLANGTLAVFAEGSSFSACETWFASEFLVDPILIAADEADEANDYTRHRGASRATVPAYIAGHSCLDEDVITNRYVHFPKRPKAGDLLVYANTAGYQMDLLENEFHRHPMPRRVAASFDAAGGMEISPDVSLEVSA